MPRNIYINKDKGLGRLPAWNLSDFYTNPYSKSLKKDLKKIQEISKKFEKKYEGKVKNLNSNKLYIAITELERINELMHKIISYAYLLYSKDMKNKKNKIFLQKIQEEITLYSSTLIFFNLELNIISNEKLLKYFRNNKILKYKNWIEKSRLFKDHQLNKELEKLMNDKNITASMAWSRLFDETISSLKFHFRGKEHSTTEIFNYLSDKDKRKRKESGIIIGKTLKKNINIFTTITNTLAKDKGINDKWRKFPNSVSSRNLSNFVEDKVVETLSSSVKGYYPKLSHRYYSLKAKWLKKKRLMYWDRNAPLPFQINKIYTWNEAREIVISSFESFDKDIGNIAKQFFDKKWIDAAVSQGKQPGAFSASTVPSVHPFILLNYQGKLRDVATLAHELGHGIHQYLAAEQGYFNSSTPLTLAETASVFGEMLTFKYLLINETDKKNKKALLANKVEDMLNTVVRQIAFFEFEKEVHFQRQKSELSTNNICDIWMNTQKSSFGPSVKLDEDYKYYWSYIPHFIHSPFYVYAYAFGDCLVNTLYSLYEENLNDFQMQYINLLKAGGSKKYTDLLKPFNIDPLKKYFWKKGLNIISKFIDDLEKL